MDVPRVPLHRSLIFRLLAASLTIATVAVVATAWLATQAASQTIQKQIGQSLSDDKNVYDELLAHAATHQDWSGVSPLLTTLAAKIQRRITLTTDTLRVIADSAPGPSLADARPSATVDALAVDAALTGRTNRIDYRIVGPYRLTAAEQRSIREQLTTALDCLHDGGAEGRIVSGHFGRPKVAVTELGKLDSLCELVPSTAKSEQRPLAQLRRLVAACAGEKDPEQVSIAADLTIRIVDPQTFQSDPAREAEATACLDGSLRTQLDPYVAPPALLFVTDPADPTSGQVFPLSRRNLIRTGTVTAVVLALAVVVTVLVGRRLTRPLRALTEAARRPDGHPRVKVTGRDEIGYLAAALDELAERREQSEQQRRAMVSDVAHELRNPLTNIKTWLEAVHDGLATVDGPVLTLLQEQTAQLQHIVDDLRDLAAADAGTFRMHPEATFVNDVAAQVVDAHRPNAATARVGLATEFDDDPELLVDPVRVRQLIGNLLSNAIRHTPPGGTVTVRTSTGDDRFVLAVADTGVGIDPGDLPKIFERFWRTDQSRTRHTGGSGLGLSIARQIADAHGGEITVSSEVGVGTTVTVSLPASHAPTG
ncbi:HAMP domain-containing sensor histidine kinase [Actinoplanes sichuanensis]|uniref:histidine kinase n=1 Tax=Actinoplanes sichuanensis TaxID=512349 RepID=A0ABW4ARE5_9ACTN|nr:HAMP domain-containing sensor histidine kinase [Actinoplanes sichuanensis]BEL05898.1 HAMP domain-containing sensor histidine kinase [Actinoplanes sichuanensis]